MSNWTHVSAIVRLNNMKAAIINPQKLSSTNVIRELHGMDPIDPVKMFTDEILDAFNRSVPCGSEGPLKFALRIWPTGEGFGMAGCTSHLTKGSLYWGDVIISGDLRDFDDPDLVLQWLEMSCEALPQGVGVRDGTLLAYSEQGETLVVIHEDMYAGRPLA